jgi:SAM-dependent methyltransferase
MSPTDRPPRFCNLCRAPRPHDHLFDKAGFPILRCGRCRLVSTAVDARAFDPGAIYDATYFEGGQADGYASYGATQPVLLRQARRTLRLLSRYCAGGRLLEIGCAYGFFLEEASKRFEAVGLDVSEHAVEQARARGLDARAGRIHDAELPDGHFDAVVILDTIEHLPDPYEVLAAAARVSRPGAALLVTTGDVESLLARLTGRHWRLMTPPQHLYFFSRRTLAAMARATGWRPVGFRYPWRHVPLALAAYQVLARTLGVRKIPIPSHLGLPMNLFDCMAMVAIRE